MKKKLYFMFTILICLIFMFMLFKTQILNYQRLINASIIDTETNDIVIKAAKKMVNENINNYKKDDTIKISILELIKNGYIKEEILEKENIKKDDYVYIIVENKNIKDIYIKSNNLNDYLLTLSDKDNFIKIDDNYYYVGVNVNNYLVMDNELYRIIKIDKEKNVYIIKNDREKEISINKIKEYYEKYNINNEFVSEVNLLDIIDYNNTLLNNETFLEKDYSYFIKENDNYLSINNYTNSEYSFIRSTLKLNKNLYITNGNGSIVNPFIIEN